MNRIEIAARLMASLPEGDAAWKFRAEQALAGADALLSAAGEGEEKPSFGGPESGYDDHKGRIYYQDLVYDVCNVIDSVRGGKVVCGTYQTPSDELGKVIREVVRKPEPQIKEGKEPIDKAHTGIYRKFNVSRTDGSSGHGGKHENCEYFVLDWDHDPFSLPAIRAYADACSMTYPVLARELREKLKAHGFEMFEPKPVTAGDLEEVAKDCELEAKAMRRAGIKSNEDAMHADPTASGEIASAIRTLAAQRDKAESALRAASQPQPPRMREEELQEKRDWLEKGMKALDGQPEYTVLQKLWVNVNTELAALDAAEKEKK